MVRDGIFYAFGLLAAAALVWWLASPYSPALSAVVAVIAVVLAVFFLWFFRDPERTIPAEPGLIVSPADGKVTDVSTINVNGVPRTRISIFLNVFSVHVNRTPIAGTIREVQYQKGKFGNAM